MAGPQSTKPSRVRPRSPFRVASHPPRLPVSPVWPSLCLHLPVHFHRCQVDGVGAPGTLMSTCRRHRCLTPGHRHHPKEIRAAGSWATTGQLSVSTDSPPRSRRRSGIATCGLSCLALFSGRPVCEPGARWSVSGSLVPFRVGFRRWRDHAALTVTGAASTFRLLRAVQP